MGSVGVPSDDAGETEASERLRVMAVTRGRYERGIEETKAVRCGTRVNTRLLWA